MDTTTQGNWKTTYNYPNVTIIGNGFTNLTTPTPSGASLFVWSTSTTAIQALQDLSSTGRIAAAWNASTFSVDIKFSDQALHQIAIYCLDWNAKGRTETISVLDANTKTVLDTRSVSNFGNGVYMLWNVTGHVKLRITSTSGKNAVISGVFLN
jgi:hypothetical protein